MSDETRDECREWLERHGWAVVIQIWDAAIDAERARVAASLADPLQAMVSDAESLGLYDDEFAQSEARTQAPGGDARDAARYRWLRDFSQPAICAFYLSVGKAFDGVRFTRETVDAAIDEQIASAPSSPPSSGEPES